MIKNLNYSPVTEDSIANVNASVSPALTDTIFHKLNDFIYQQTGIFLTTNQKKFIEKRLSKRLNTLEIEDFEQYFNILLDRAYTHQELPHLIDAITVNETQFFRNQAQNNAIIEVVLPELFEMKKVTKDLSIKILSVGCSSGEEPYTIAMMLDQTLIELLKNFTVSILGTDLNSKILEQAKRGLYDEFTVQQIDASILARYFQKKGLNYQLNSNIRKMVQFKAANLIDEIQMTALGQFDLILCRNVLLYLDDEAKKHAVEVLHKILNPEGYLFIGHSESLHGLSDSFKLTHFVKAIGYKKSNSE